MEDTVGGWLFGGFKVLGKVSLVDPFITRGGVLGCSERWEPEATERTEPKLAAARAPAPPGRVVFFCTDGVEAVASVCSSCSSASSLARRAYTPLSLVSMLAFNPDSEDERGIVWR